MNFDDSVRYMKSHEWARKAGDDIVTGVSDYAQDSLGDVVFVELPEVGAKFNKGDAFGVVESVKAASDVFIPMGGEIIEVNRNLDDNPSLVNESPFGEGWLIKFRPSDPGEYDSLMDAAAYQKYTEELED
jgi:glycine cleavage system H protein